jgi:hypothetical protein
MALLVMILAISTKLSLNLLIYRSFIKLIYDEDLCSICLSLNGDYYHPICKNFFHTKKCLSLWVEKKDKCPLCNEPI